MTQPPQIVFTVLIHEADEGGYWAHVAELPGCASQGETLDELRANITEAIVAWLEASDETTHRHTLLGTWNIAIEAPHHPSKASASA